MRHIRLLFCLMLVSLLAPVSQVLAADTQPTKSLHWRRNLTTAAPDYWVVFPRVQGQDAKAAQIFLLLSAEDTVEVRCKYMYDNTNKDVTLYPNAKLFVPLDATKVYYNKTDVDSKSWGVHVYSRGADKPFRCEAYIVTETGRDAAAVIPTRDLGTEYMLQACPGQGTSDVAILVPEKSTKISIISSKTTTKTVVNSGQVWLYEKISTGDKVVSDKPIAVFTATTNAQVPLDNRYSIVDFSFEQVLPNSRWGKEFYVALLAGTKANVCMVTALEDETKVTISSSSYNKPVELKQGESHIIDEKTITTENSNIVISSDKPILCYDYMTNSFENPDLSIGQKAFMGAVSNSMVPSWDMRVKKMTFMVDTLKTAIGSKEETEQLHQNMYVQVVVKSSDKSKLTLNGTKVESSQFKDFTGKVGDVQMAYANIALDSVSDYLLETDGDGFVGMVYALCEGKSYMYPLGYNPHPYRDALSLRNMDEDSEGNLTPSSDWTPLEQYMDMEYGREILDSKHICDSMTLEFQTTSNEKYIYDSVRWKVWQMDNGTTETFVTAVVDSLAETFASSDPLTLTYKFIIPSEDGKKIADALDYEVQAIMMRGHKYEPNTYKKPQEADTLRARVHVTKKFNDTIDFIMCVNDTIPFFIDASNGKPDADGYYALTEKNDTTKFVALKLKPNQQAEPETKGYKIILPSGGPYTFTRKYESSAGCDSTITARIFVCDTTNTHLKDTTINVGQILRFPYSKHENEFFYKRDTLWDNEGIYTIVDTLRRVPCQCADFEDPDFIGCDSLVFLNVKVVPLVVDTLHIDLCDSVYTKKADPAKENNFNWSGKFHYRFAENHTNSNLEVFETSGNAYSTQTVKGTDVLNTANKYLKKQLKQDPKTKSATLIFKDKDYKYASGKKAEFVLVLTVHKSFYHLDTLEVCGADRDKYVWPNRPEEKIPDDLIQNLEDSTWRRLDRIWRCYNDNLCYNAKDGTYYDPIKTTGLTNPNPVFSMDVPGDVVYHIDSVYLLDIIYHKTYSLDSTVAICESRYKQDEPIPYVLHDGDNEPETIDLHKYKNGEKFKDKYHTKYGCDSIYTVTVKVVPDHGGVINHDIVKVCQNKDTSIWVNDNGVPFEFIPSVMSERYPGQTLFPYEHEFKTEGDCEAKESWTIQIMPTYENADKDTVICKPISVPGDPNYKRYFDRTNNEYLSKKKEGDKVWWHQAKQYVNVDSIPLLKSLAQDFRPSSSSTYAENYPFKITLRDTLKTEECQCDSIWHLTITVRDRKGDIDTIHISEEDSIRFAGEWFAAPKCPNKEGKTLLQHREGYTTGLDTIIIHRNGLPSEEDESCEPLIVRKIIIAPVYRDTLYDVTCDTCAYTWVDSWAGDAVQRLPDQELMAPANTTVYFTDSCTSVYGKLKEFGYEGDSTFVLALTGFPSYHMVDIHDKACQNDFIDGVGLFEHPEEHKLFAYDAETKEIGEPLVNITNSRVGDHVYVDSLKIKQEYHNPMPKPGQDPVVVPNCDSVIIYHLHIDSTYFATDTMYLCENDTAYWRGKLYVGPKFDKSSIPASTEKTELTFDMMEEDPSFAKKTWKYDKETSKLQSKCDCDSTFGLILYVHKTDTMDWSAFRPDERDTIQDYDTTFISLGFNFGNHYGGKVDYTSGDRKPYDTTFTYTYKGDNTLYGCDSMVTYSLHIKPCYRFVTEHQMCYGDYYYWPEDWPSVYPEGSDGTDINLGKNYRFEDPSQLLIYDSIPFKSVEYGTDSVYILIIRPRDTHISILDPQHVCEKDVSTKFPNYNVLPFMWDTQSPIQIQTSANKTETNCGELIISPAFFHKEYFGDTVDVTILKSRDDSDPYPYEKPFISEWSGKEYDKAGIYEDTARIKRAGCDCDSIRILRVTECEVYYNFKPVTICLENGETFKWTDHYEATEKYKQDFEWTPTEAGTFVFGDTSKLATGCDSIRIVELNVRAKEIKDEYLSLCANKMEDKFGRHFYGSKFDLSGIKDVDETYICCPLGDTICEVPNEDAASARCGAYYRVHVTTNAISEPYLEETICEGEFFKVGDNKYDTEGEYEDTLVNASGCDSIVHLTLHIAKPFIDTTKAIICLNDEPYTWRFKDTLYLSDKAGFFRDSVVEKTHHGCDSIRYLELTVNQAYYFNEDSVRYGNFEPFKWHDQTIEFSEEDMKKLTGDTIILYYDSLTTKGSRCDSIYQLNLRVSPIIPITRDTTICEGDVYDSIPFHDLVVAGTYDTIVRNDEKGVYEAITLNLEVVPETRVSVSSDSIFVCADDQNFAVRYAFEGTPVKFFNVYYDKQGHAAGLIDQDSLPISSEDSIFIPLPYDEEDRTKYVRPGSYKATLLFDNGVCMDSVEMTKKIRFEVRYPSWITEQHWNDMIGILVPSLNGGYNFDSYQWYRNDTMLIGETRPYLYAPHYLMENAEYSVALVREGEAESYFTCPIIPVLLPEDALAPTMPYVSVVPSYVLRANPVVNILSINPGTYMIYNSFGALVTQGQFTPDQHHAYEITLPASTGVYIFYLNEDSGIQRTAKVIVN